eukprot:6040209-Pleurochrysis_carterae.AAC.1
MCSVCALENSARSKRSRHVAASRAPSCPAWQASVAVPYSVICTIEAAFRPIGVKGDNWVRCRYLPTLPNLHVAPALCLRGRRLCLCGRRRVSTLALLRLDVLGDEVVVACHNEMRRDRRAETR